MQKHQPRTQDERIEPSDGADFAELELPEVIARQAQALVGADEPPRTLGEQSELFAQTEAFQAREAGDVEEMLVADESRHAVHVAEDTIYTHCFLDALGIALLHPRPTVVTTRPPGLDERIELAVSREGISGATPDMVVAYGFSTGLPTEVEALEALSPEETLAAMHEHGCPTQNLFPSEAAYEAWAREANAATMPMSLPQAFAMVRDYVQDWELDPATAEDSIDIRPSQGDDYTDRELTDGIADALQLLAGLAGVERAPQTLGDFVELNARMDAFSPDQMSVEELLISDDASRHQVRIEDRTAYTYCILDALILGFLEDEPVGVATRPPGAEETIEFTTSRRGIEGAHGGMVVSFGFSSDLPTDPSAFEGQPEEVLDSAHRFGCPRINLFEDGDAYEAWAREAAAVTMPMSLPQALALARDIVRSWGHPPAELGPHPDQRALQGGTR